MDNIHVEPDYMIDFDIGLGESPVWDDHRNLLWFVDITAPSVISVDPITRQTRHYPMPSAVGSLGLTQDSRLVVALRTGVHFFDPKTGVFELIANPEPDRAMNRLNDGKVGPDGSFWVGSMHDALPREATAALYRVEATGTCTRVLDHLYVSNGLAWSPDGKTMYHADTRGSLVRAFDFDSATGAVSNARPFVALGEAEGLPDGAAVDMEGFYWSAGITAGRLNRISPAGAIVASYAVPAPAPTMPCFGGPDMKTLFVTSLTTDRLGHRVAGSLLAFPVDVAGVAIGRFGPRTI